MGVMAGANRGGQVLEVSLRRTMGEEGDGSRTLTFDDLTQALTDLGVGLIPADIPEDTLSSFAGTKLRFEQTIRVFVETDSPDAARAEAAPAEGMAGHSTDVEGLASFTDFNVDAALPKAHTTDRSNRVIGGRWKESWMICSVGEVVSAGLSRGKDDCGSTRRPGKTKADELTPRMAVGTHLTPLCYISRQQKHT
jgi:hypothetical protein